MEHKKLKILYVITKSNWGGAQRYVFDLATSLPKDHFDVSVVLGGKGPLKDKLEAAGVRVIHLPRLGRNVSLDADLAVFLELISLFKKERSDIIHLNSSKIGIMGALAGRIARIPKIVFTAHGWAFNEPRPWWQRILILKLHWWTIMLAHRTIVVSDMTRAQVAWLPLVARKIVVIHNGIRPFAHLDRRAAREFLRESNHELQDAVRYDDLWAGTISELHKNKGLDIAIDAMEQAVKHIPHLRFLIVGDGEERNALSSLVHERKLDDHVFFFGHVDAAGRILKALDIFLLSSVKEGLPYVLIEAGMVGLPVIATRVGGVPEVVRLPDQGVLVPPEDPHAIASAILDLAGKAELRDKMASALRAHVLKNFTLDRMVEKTMEIYRD